MPSTDSISCQDFEQRIHDTLDSRRPLLKDAVLCCHAAGCPSCTELLQSYLWLDDPRPEIFPSVEGRLSDGFAADIVAQATREEAASAPVSLPPQRRMAPAEGLWSRQAWLATVGVSVAVLATMLFAQHLLPSRPAPAVSMPEIPTEFHGDPSMAYDSYEMIIAQLGMLDEEAIEQTIDRTIESAEVPEGFRPITSSLGVAFDLLRGAIPGARPRMKPQAHSTQRVRGMHLA